MSQRSLCPICQLPRPLVAEGEVCPEHPQRVMLSEAQAAQARDDLYLGVILEGKYELMSALGHGGFGAVYHAVQRGQIRREVAVKLLTRQSPEYLDLFRDEMRVVAQLRSPYTVRYLDSGVHHDALLGRELPFMVMELLRGETLAHRLIHHGALNPELAVELFGHLLDSLDEAHSFGIVHRDLKPLNLMITPTRQGGEQLTVLDFGVARVADQASREATRNRVMGTPYYLAPEVLLHQEVTPSGDLFATAVILYEALSCRSPFLNEELQGVEPYLKLRALYREGAPFEPLPSHLHERFQPFFERALAVDPQARFRSALEMRTALYACLNPLPAPPIKQLTDTLRHATALDLVAIELEADGLEGDELEGDALEDLDPTEATPNPMRDETLLNPLPPTEMGSTEMGSTEMRERESVTEEAPPTRVNPLSVNEAQRAHTEPSPPLKPSPKNIPPAQAPSPTLTPSARLERPVMSDVPTNDLLLTALPPPRNAKRHRAVHSLLSRLLENPSTMIHIALIGAGGLLAGATLWWLSSAPPPDPCALTAPQLIAPFHVRALQEPSEVITAPPPSSLERLKSGRVERPCVSEDEEGCVEGQVSCELPPIIAQRASLDAEELQRCREAGACEGDSSAARPCDPERPTTPCLTLSAAYSYCAWRGLKLPSLNAWARLSQAHALNKNSAHAHWALSPLGAPLLMSLPASGHAALTAATPQSYAAVTCVSDRKAH